MINYSRTTCPTEILMSFLNLTDNLLQDAYIIFFFQKRVNNFKMLQITMIKNTLQIIISYLITYRKFTLSSKIQFW